MNYVEGVKYMKNLCTKGEGEGEGTFSPYPGILISYPGKKKSGDYRLTVENGNAPTHANISKSLYNLIINKRHSFQEVVSMLNDTYNNGTDTTYNDSELEYLQNLIYWITLQEEINYPRSLRYAGINLAFCRFFEASYSATQSSFFTIDDVIARCNNHGREKPKLYQIDSHPDFYKY